jgi:hypothetical protein
VFSPLLFITNLYSRRALSLSAQQKSTNLQEANMQERLNSLLLHIKDWMRYQDIFMPVASQLRDSRDLSSIPVETIPLYLPSSLPPELADAFPELRKVELSLRTAQLNDSLVELRRLRRIMQQVQLFRRHHGLYSQRSTTRIQDTLGRFRLKSERCISRYRAAHETMKRLDPAGVWQQSFRDLKDEDVRGPGRNEEEEPGEGKREPSWIWQRVDVEGAEEEFLDSESLLHYIFHILTKSLRCSCGVG